MKKANFGVVISTTVNKTNIAQIPKLIDLSVDVGASVFKTTFFIPTGRGKSNQQELSLDSEDVHRLALLIMEKEKEVGDYLIIEQDGFYPWLLEKNYPSEPAWMRSKNVGCAAGTSQPFYHCRWRCSTLPFFTTDSNR